MPIQIKTFGKLTELTGNVPVEVADAADTDSLKAALTKRFPQLSDIKFFIAINGSMVTGNTFIPADAVVALLPPFSGG